VRSRRDHRCGCDHASGTVGELVAQHTTHEIVIELAAIRRRSPAGLREACARGATQHEASTVRIVPTEGLATLIGAIEGTGAVHRADRFAATRLSKPRSSR